MKINVFLRMIFNINKSFFMFRMKKIIMTNLFEIMLKLKNQFMKKLKLKKYYLTS